MTNEEIDEVCCRFAGIKPVFGFVPTCPDKDCDCNHRELWPKVSTNWAAAGMLMDALIKMNVLYEADGDGADGYQFVHSMSLWWSPNYGVEPRTRVDVSGAATFPLALA